MVTKTTKTETEPVEATIEPTAGASVRVAVDPDDYDGIDSVHGVISWVRGDEFGVVAYLPDGSTPTLVCGVLHPNRDAVDASMAEHAKDIPSRRDPDNDRRRIQAQPAEALRWVPHVYQG